MKKHFFVDIHIVNYSLFNLLSLLDTFLWDRGMMKSLIQVNTPKICEKRASFQAVFVKFLPLP